MTRCAGDIIDAVASAFSVPREVMLSPHQTQRLAQARWAAMRIMRNERCLSYPVIGRLMGRDHSTVMNGLRRAEALLQHDPDFAARYERAAS